MTTPTLNASSRIMYEEAQKLGIECVVFNDRETILMKKGNHQWYVRGSRTSLQSSVGKTIADKKYLTKEILNHFRLPTAKSVKITSYKDPSKLAELTFPIVLKPTEERYGKGVIIGLKSQAEAEIAIEKNQMALPILAEEMLTGTEYRIMCVNYKFVAAAYRYPANVTGNGQDTIQALIDLKNQHPWRGKGHSSNLTLIEVDDVVLENLAEQNMTLDSIPAQDQTVLLRKTANLSTGGEAWDVTAEVSPENQLLFEQIAEVCDLNIVGIDVMCQSLTTPVVDQAKAGVIEVNASPGLRMHHYPIKGQTQNVAKLILEMVLANEPHS